MVTLAIEWTQPEVAAEWANALVQRLNRRLRERALREAETNVAYLQAEMARTNSGHAAAIHRDDCWKTNCRS
jgi:hypothetical protein